MNRATIFRKINRFRTVLKIRPDEFDSARGHDPSRDVLGVLRPSRITALRRTGSRSTHGRSRSR